MTDEASGSAGVEHGDPCLIVAGRHAGRSGVVEDRRTSRTGHVTVTVREESGERVKTLGRNVVLRSR